jgi:hypothetical protein
VEERQVLSLIVEGKANKVIAQELLMGLRTVEVRRHHVFRKMKAGSLAELMWMVFELESSAPVVAAPVARNPIGQPHSLSSPHFLTVLADEFLRLPTKYALDRSTGK